MMKFRVVYGTEVHECETDHEARMVRRTLDQERIEAGKKLIPASIEEYRKGALMRNAAKCGRCGDVVESKFRHDFRSCSCGAIFVDGGLAYCRRGCEPGVEIEDMCESGDCWVDVNAF